MRLLPDPIPYCILSYTLLGGRNTESQSSEGSKFHAGMFILNHCLKKKPSMAWKISKVFGISVIKIPSCVCSLAQVFVCTYSRQVIRCIILTQCLAAWMLCKLNGSVPVFCMSIQDKRAKEPFPKSYRSIAMPITVFMEKGSSVWCWSHSTSDSGYTYTEILAEGFVVGTHPALLTCWLGPSF